MLTVNWWTMKGLGIYSSVLFLNRNDCFFCLYNDDMSAGIMNQRVLLLLTTLSLCLNKDSSNKDTLICTITLTPPKIISACKSLFVQTSWTRSRVAALMKRLCMCLFVCMCVCLMTIYGTIHLMSLGTACNSY